MTDTTPTTTSGTIGLKVIGAGFGRTGTSSLKKALEILGYGPCYHMSEVFRNDNHTQCWNDNVGLTDTPTKQDFDYIFSNFQSTTDFPAASYYQQLVQHYPDAKVILSVRDTSEKWWESFEQTIIPASDMWRLLFKITLMENKLFDDMVLHTVWNPLFGGRANARDKDIAMATYEAHNIRVQHVVPAHKLLVFNVKQGWEPLCKFLGCDIPEEDFPHVNDAQFIKARNQSKRRKAVMRLAIMGVVVVASVGLFWWNKNSKDKQQSRDSGGSSTRILATSTATDLLSAMAYGSNEGWRN